MALSGKDLLSGVVVPAVTPIGGHGGPDFAAGCGYFDALAAVGVEKIMLLGTNGEGPLFDTQSIGQFLADAVGQWKRRVPGGTVVVNVSAAGTRESLLRAEAAAAAGSDALVLSPPFYFQHSERDIAAHYHAARAASLPVIAYNTPRYASPLAAGSIRALAEMPHVVGVKDSSGDAAVLAEWLEVSRRRPDFGVSQGAEQYLYDALAAGADGITPGIANIAPRVAVELVAAHRGDDDVRAARAQERIVRVMKIHHVRPGVPVVKAALALRGLCPADLAPPLRVLDDDETADLRRFLSTVEHELIGTSDG
ncbi:dihydrodipicolinate synthase family protein [Plantactinospora sp. KLBMP9567]|uniref:dihydrodipicolinate synthase family protein n=1 Tax=Plantactinospora sp. KLBMP9567 TaxID=3085900 RepID=UPI002982B1AC|nr:dihydrodipicolinate synthase family protein [Plantactinospora sp. KLBMP9567]MDW5324430.1 dihydrodipicolinate synthase family protein [Plantactinospora sp. KLBMP9567]